MGYISKYSGDLIEATLDNVSKIDTIVGNWDATDNLDIITELGEHNAIPSDSTYYKGLWGQTRIIAESVDSERDRALSAELQNAQTITNVANTVISNKTEIDNKLAAVTTAIDDVATQTAALSEDVNDITTTVDTTIADIGTIDTRLSAVEDTISIHSQSLENLEENQPAKCMVSPQVVFKGTSNTILISGEFGILTPTSIDLLKDGEVISTSETNPHNTTTTITPQQDILFTAKGYYSNNLVFTAKSTLYAVDPIYVGASLSDVANTAKTDVAVSSNKLTARRSINGSYNITIENDGEFVWVFVPTSLTVARIKATMSGFEFPLESAVIVFIGGTSMLDGGIQYRAYRSSNMMVKGTYNIVVNS